MIQHGVPRQLAERTGRMAVNCGRLFEDCTEDLAAVAAFVEAEMKGQKLPETVSGRDAFIAETFSRLYPMVLQSEECRPALEAMMQKHPEFPESRPFSQHDAQPHYTIGREMAEALYAAGSAVIGSILMVTSGETERPLLTDEGVQYKPGFAKQGIQHDPNP